MKHKFKPKDRRMKRVVHVRRMKRYLKGLAANVKEWPMFVTQGNWPTNKAELPYRLLVYLKERVK